MKGPYDETWTCDMKHDQNMAEQQQEKDPKFEKLKNYSITFASGYFSGICGEIFSYWQDGKLNAIAMTSYNFKDNSMISGTQQVAKELSKELLKKHTTLNRLARENPFLFGTCTGLPMWVMTRIVASPIQNAHKFKPKAPYEGFEDSIIQDVTYHTIKNGIDEYAAANIFPYVLPKIDTFVTKKFVEGSIAGAIGGACYVFAWPAKTLITGQSLPTAFDLCVKNAPKVAIKKIAYTLARPKLVQYLNK